MDELDAFNIIIGEGVATSKNNDEKKIRISTSENWKYVKWAIYGFLLLLLILYFAIHPIDRLFLQFALFDNYEIGLVATSQTSTTGGTVKVDGNIMFLDGKYYEIGEEKSYEYREYDGQWYRYRYYPNDRYTEDVEYILNSSNIERHFLPFIHMDINKKEAFGLTDPKIQVLLSGCEITGKDKIWDYWYGKSTEVEIRLTINKFGLIRLELPENYIIVE
ncbi:MAG: hypothetical protein IKJ25_05325 [Clostridia bacterium]|nr:hypothetical protein [Clostridia bacterium]